MPLILTAISWMDFHQDTGSPPSSLHRVSAGTQDTPTSGSGTFAPSHSLPPLVQTATSVALWDLSLSCLTSFPHLVLPAPQTPLSLSIVTFSSPSHWFMASKTPPYGLQPEETPHLRHSLLTRIDGGMSAGPSLLSTDTHRKGQTLSGLCHSSREPRPTGTCEEA